MWLIKYGHTQYLSGYFRWTLHFRSFFYDNLNNSRFFLCVCCCIVLCLNELKSRVFECGMHECVSLSGLHMVDDNSVSTPCRMLVCVCVCYFYASLCMYYWSWFQQQKRTNEANHARSILHYTSPASDDRSAIERCDITCVLFIYRTLGVNAILCVFYILHCSSSRVEHTIYKSVFIFEIPEYISLISCGVTISVTPPKSLILINIIVLINNCNRISSIHFEWMNWERDDAKWKIYDINIDSEWRDGETFLQYWSTWFRFHLHQLLCVQGFFVHFVNEREVIVLPMTLCRDGYA